MGTCESLFLTKREKSKHKNPYDNNDQDYLKNKGPNFYCAPIDSSVKNDNVYVNDVSISQTTMTMDMSQYNNYNRRPQIYQYINKYKTNGLQNSVVKASLVELGQGNSLVYSNIKNSKVNQTNSLYTSKYDDTGYESSYDGYEMIIDGKMDEELVQKSNDKNTINNYNEFIKKIDNNNKNNNNAKNQKIMDYYKKNINNDNNKDNNNKNNINNKNLDVILEESNKEGDELSRIPSSADINKLKINNINNNVNNNKNINNNKNNNNIKNNMQRYIQSMGKY